MVSLAQYPHFLYAFHPGEATRNANGSYIAATGEWKLISACREETNGKGTKIQLTNSETYVYASLIQIPVGAARIPEGTKIAVTAFEVETEYLSDEAWLEASRRVGLVRITGEVAKYDVGRLHNRCWI
jgi:hypothetical protein